MPFEMLRRVQRARVGALLVALGSGGCQFETSAPPAPPAEVRPAPAAAPGATTTATPPSAPRETTTAAAPWTGRETSTTGARPPAPRDDDAARSTAAADQPASANAPLRVRKVIDGDTITVSGIGTVRLLGVDAPEKTGGYRGAEPFGDEATRFMRVLVDGKLVRLEYDGERKDQFNRTLAYVVLEDGTIANEAIIRAGWAETYRRFTYRLKPQFQAAEREARDAGRGMWTGQSRRP